VRSRLPNFRNAFAKARLRNTALIAAAVASVSFPASARPFLWDTIANSATVIPNTENRNFSSFNQPSINTKCFVTFRARGTGPSTPPKGIYYARMCDDDRSIKTFLSGGMTVPWPNNTGASFREFPAFSRIDLNANFMATRGQSDPVWSYTTPEGDTKVGTAGIYVARGNKFKPYTAANLLGAVPGFSDFEVPGFPGLRFDQFPGAPVPFDKKRVAFKGNYTETIGATEISRTGVYFRKVYGGSLAIKKIADTHDMIPRGTTTFGSTAPPSAANGRVVFLGLDNEDAPTQGGIYEVKVVRKNKKKRPFKLKPVVRIGKKVPQSGKQRFTEFGEGISYNGTLMAFWAGWGPDRRVIRLHCPVDGNADLIAACKEQCPAVDTEGNYCEREVPVKQGIFVRDANGEISRAASTRKKEGGFEDFLFWVFSGRPPGVGKGDEEDDEAEPPRWRSSAFAAMSANRNDEPAVIFKATRRNGQEGLFAKAGPRAKIKPLLLIGSDARSIDPQAPAGAKVTAVGVERDGFRNCRGVVNASFLDEATTESWAGIYIVRNGCKRKK
jgi:hypothetical protein